MANGRFISTTIATDKRLAELSVEAEYLFLKTIPHLDRDGLILADSLILWAKVCPRRPSLMDFMQDAILQWNVTGLAVHYETSEGHALHFPNFAKNQAGMRYNREGASKIAPPPGFVRTESGLIPESGDNPQIKSAPTPDLLRTCSGPTPPQVQVQVQDQVEVQDQDQVQVEAQDGGAVGAGDSFSLDDEVSKISNRLQQVGVGLTPYIVDEYKELAKEFGFEAVMRGITAAADNGKQTKIRYVTSCIRNIAQGTAPKASNGKLNGSAEVANAWETFLQ